MSKVASLGLRTDTTDQAAPHLVCHSDVALLSLPERTSWYQEKYTLVSGCIDCPCMLDTLSYGNLPAGKYNYF